MVVLQPKQKQYEQADFIYSHPVPSSFNDSSLVGIMTEA